MAVPVSQARFDQQRSLVEQLQTQITTGRDQVRGWERQLAEEQAILGDLQVTPAP